LNFLEFKRDPIGPNVCMNSSSFDSGFLAILKSGELAGLSELPKFHTLKLEHVSAESLSLDHLGVLTRCAQLTRVDLIEVVGLPLLARDWMDRIHDELDSLRVGRDAVDVPKSSIVVDAASAIRPAVNQCALMEIDDGGAHATPISAAAATPEPCAAAGASGLPPTAGASSSSTSASVVATASFRDLRSLLSTCRRLSHLAWIADLDVIQSSAAYTKQRSRVGCGMSKKDAHPSMRAREQRERARERHALRQLIRQRSIAISSVAAAAAAVVSSALVGVDDVLGPDLSTAPVAVDPHPPHLYVYTRARESNSERACLDCLNDPSEASMVSGGQFDAEAESTAQLGTAAADAVEMEAELAEETEATERMHDSISNRTRQRKSKKQAGPADTTKSKS
jgi:hypothetical protein